MKKTSPTQNATPLEAVVTAHAKREAKSLGIPLTSYISHLAAKADRLPMTIQVRMEHINLISRIAKNGDVRNWLELCVDDIIQTEIRNLPHLAAKN